VNKILSGASEVPVAAKVVTGVESSFARERLITLVQECAIRYCVLT
jgi:hypothetical protein